MTSVLLFAACGGDDTATEEPSAPTEEPSADDERQADVAAAEKIVLTLADFEPGWEASPPEDDPDTEDLDEDLADCLGITLEELEPDNPSADSDTFTSANDEEVEASVAITPTEADAEKAMDRFEGSEALDCLGQYFRSLIGRGFAENAGEMPDDLEIGDPTLNEVSVPALGDEAKGLRLTTPLSSSGVDVDLYIDFVIVRVGRVGITTTFLSTFTPFSETEAAEFVEAMVDRVPADL